VRHETQASTARRRFCLGSSGRTGSLCGASEAMLVENVEVLWEKGAWRRVGDSAEDARDPGKQPHGGPKQVLLIGQLPLPPAHSRSSRGWTFLRGRSLGNIQALTLEI
jgi:hypothetical protein